MPLTVTAMARFDYSLYKFSGMQADSESGASDAQAVSEHYGLSDVTSALESLGGPVDFRTIGNIGEYAKNRVLLSQSSAKDSQALNFSSVTGAEQASVTEALKQKLGLADSAVNLYGVSGATGSAKLGLETASFSAYLNSLAASGTGSYQDFLKENGITGGFLNTTA